MKLKYYKMAKDVLDPTFATAGAACFDIFSYITEDTPITVYDMSNKKIKRKPEWYGRHTPKIAIRIAPADRILLPTGLIFDIPENYSVRLHTRSSVSLKNGLILANSEGIIDSDYYHQAFVMLYNASADEVLIKNEERIAQGELVKNYKYDIEETEDVPQKKTTRVGGFGSTGKG